MSAGMDLLQLHVHPTTTCSIQLGKEKVLLIHQDICCNFTHTSTAKTKQNKKITEEDSRESNVFFSNAHLRMTTNRSICVRIDY